MTVYPSPRSWLPPVLFFLGTAGLGMAVSHTHADGPGPAEAPSRYAVKRRVPPSLEPIYRHLTPGGDAFPEEKQAQELAARLEQLGALLRASPRRAPEVARLLLAPGFKGGRLGAAARTTAGAVPLELTRADPPSTDLELDGPAFGAELAALVAGLDTIQTAELLITSITVPREAEAPVQTRVRYDIVGTGPKAWRAERLGRWRMDWRRVDGAWRVVAWASEEASGSLAATPIFNEVTAAAIGQDEAFRRQLHDGVDHWIGRLDAVFSPGGMGHHGVSAGDADGDGLDDLYVSQPAGLPNRLFRNRGDGTFEDKTAAAGLAVLDSTSQSLFVDVDNDGDQDLILVTRSGPLLFLNDGKGRFTQAKDAFRTRGPLHGAPTSIAMADYDGDGFLDVYLCTYSYFIGASEDKAGTPTPYHDARNGPPNVLFRNDGHGRFTDVTAETGLDQNNDRFSFAAAWGDYDGDGRPDLLVANDFGRKNLYHNEGLQGGTVRFRDVAAQAGVEDVGAGMSAAFVDFDNDGRLDVYTGNMWSAAGLRITGLAGFKLDAPAELRALYQRHARGNSLSRNRGDGRFDDVALNARTEVGRWAGPSDALDFDSDGFADLYVANGMFTRAPGEADVDLDSFFWRQVTPASPLDYRRGTPFDDAWRATNRMLAENASQARHERNVLLRNDGRGSFDEVAGSAGLDLDQDGRSFAVLDYDGDGDPDLVLLAARSSPQLRLFRNDYAGRTASLAVRLRGTAGNRDAIGARVTVETDRMKRTRQLAAGSGFISQHSKELIFGLGASERVVALEVRWPGGRTQSFGRVPLNRRVFVEEGKDDLRDEPFRAARSPASTANASEASTDEPAAGTWLYRPFPAPPFAARDLAGQDHSLASLAGRPAVLRFGASGALRSVETLHALDQKRGGFAGASLLAIALDKPEDAAAVRSAAVGLQLPVAQADPGFGG